MIRPQRTLRTALVAMLIGVAPSSCTSREDVLPDPAPQAPAPDAWNQAAQDAAKPTEDAADVPEPVKSCAERAKALPGPTMVEVPAPDGSTYCMDRTEVTQGQYFAFLEAKGASPGGGPIRGDVTGLAEWADGCTGPEVAGSGSCLKYATLYEEAGRFACANVIPTWRLTRIPQLGFRCCLD